MSIKIFLTGLFFIVCFTQANTQNDMALPVPEHGVDTTQELVSWIANLYTFGVVTENDSLIVSAEVQSLLLNPKLREMMYPELYTWEATTYFLNRMELKKAFWYFMNLYAVPDNQELIMKVVIKYDDLFEMDIALLSAFYTYAMLDPEVADISPEGRIEIKRPDIIESKLATVKSMITYLKYYRSLSEEDQKP